MTLWIEDKMSITNILPDHDMLRQSPPYNEFYTKKLKVNFVIVKPTIFLFKFWKIKAV